MHLGRWIIAPITLMLAATTVGGGPTRVAMPKSTNAFKVLSLGLVLLASPAVALRPCDDECWSAALAAYVASPRGARESLLDLERQIQPSTPAVYVLAIADARLRSGQTERAAALFRSAVARDPAGPLADWSHLGLAYAEFRAGRLVEADHQLSKVQGFTGSSKDLVDLFSASLQSLSGAHGEARRRYEKIAADDSATPAARQNAEELAALTFYWAEDYEAAVGALEDLASGRGDGPDAMGLRYAAALAHLRAGSRRQGSRYSGEARAVRFEPIAAVAFAKRLGAAANGPPEGALCSISRRDGRDAVCGKRVVERLPRRNSRPSDAPRARRRAVGFGCRPDGTGASFARSRGRPGSRPADGEFRRQRELNR